MTPASFLDFKYQAVFTLDVFILPLKVKGIQYTIGKYQVPPLYRAALLHYRHAFYSNNDPITFFCKTFCNLMYENENKSKARVAVCNGLHIEVV
jgi:hypothetical protein